MIEFISKEIIDTQKEYMKNVRLKNEGTRKTAVVVTYGCAQNETDSDKLYAMLFEMGYEKGTDEKYADLVIYNTCSVRENAEVKVYGKVGTLKAKKKKNPDMVIGVCGCLMQQPHASERIKKTFPFVDMVFGTHVIHEFPKMLHHVLTERERVFSVDSVDGVIAEGVPVVYDKWYKASIPIMYGCNNFCTYCVVPYTRGRERSRKSEDILKEINSLCEKGLKEVTLLGQNVNSYGKDLENDLDFPDLLAAICQIDRIKRVRFVTSHPKDLTDKLIAVMGANKKICNSLHLPFQAGNNRVLKEMNRRYTREDYLTLVSKIRAAVPDIALTSDVIVGFPGETEEEFYDTLSLIREVRFDNLFTFIYSPRKDTKAALMPDPRTYEEKLKNFNELLEVQTEICREANEAYLNNTYEIIDEGLSKNNPEMRQGRTTTNKVINYKAKTDVAEGDFVTVKVTEVMSWSLVGEQEC